MRDNGVVGHAHTTATIEARSPSRARATQAPSNELKTTLVDYLARVGPTSAFNLSVGVRRRRSEVERTLRNDASFVREPGKHGAWTLTPKAQKAAQTLRDGLQGAERAQPTVHVPERRENAHAPSAG
jgi:hypothetical protein